MIVIKLASVYIEKQRPALMVVICVPEHFSDFSVQEGSILKIININTILVRYIRAYVFLNTSHSFLRKQQK